METAVAAASWVDRSARMSSMEASPRSLRRFLLAFLRCFSAVAAACAFLASLDLPIGSWGRGKGEQPTWRCGDSGRLESGPAAVPRKTVMGQAGGDGEQLRSGDDTALSTAVSISNLPESLAPTPLARPPSQSHPPALSTLHLPSTALDSERKVGADDEVKGSTFNRTCPSYPAAALPDVRPPARLLGGAYPPRTPLPSSCRTR